MEIHNYTNLLDNMGWCSSGNDPLIEKVDDLNLNQLSVAKINEMEESNDSSRFLLIKSQSELKGQIIFAFDA